MEVIRPQEQDSLKTLYFPWGTLILSPGARAAGLIPETPADAKGLYSNESLASDIDPYPFFPQVDIVVYASTEAAGWRPDHLREYTSDVTEKSWVVGVEIPEDHAWTAALEQGVLSQVVEALTDAAVVQAGLWKDPGQVFRRKVDMLKALATRFLETERPEGGQSAFLLEGVANAIDRRGAVPRPQAFAAMILRDLAVTFLGPSGSGYLESDKPNN